MKQGHRETAAPPQGVSFSRKPKLKLPHTNDKDAWKENDIALESTLLTKYSIYPTMTTQEFDKCLEGGNLFIYSTIEKLHGSKKRIKRKSGAISKHSKRARNYKELRKEKTSLRSRLKKLRKQSPQNQAEISVLRSKMR